MALLRDPNGSQAVELVKGTCDKVFLGGWWALGWLVVTAPKKVVDKECTQQRRGSGIS